MWRCILAGLDTHTAVFSQWSIVDVLDANDMLDLKEIAEMEAARG